MCSGISGDLWKWAAGFNDARFQISGPHSMKIWWNGPYLGDFPARLLYATEGKKLEERGTAFGTTIVSFHSYYIKLIVTVGGIDYQVRVTKNTGDITGTSVSVGSTTFRY